MIFYHALDTNGHLHILGTQADARAINKDFRQVDIPTDKAGLQAELQRLYTYIDELKDKIGGSMPAEAPEEPQEQTPEQPAATVSRDPPPEHPANDDLPDDDVVFNSKLLIEQVEALGSVDAPAVEKLDQLGVYHDLTGVGATFSRGVHLLNIVAAGEHQLALLFMRDKLKKRKFG